MLKTSQITKEMKRNMNHNGYNYLPHDMKIMLLKEEIHNEICEELNLKNRGEYGIEDMIMLLDRNTMVSGVNREIFSSYIYAVINILGEMQGSVISWNQETNLGSDNIKINYDEYGFVRELKTSKKSKPAAILIDLIHNLEGEHSEKLLVK